MANTKVIAIVAVLVVVVAGAGAVLVLNKDNGSKDTIDKTGRLMILGNANDDDYVDSKDVDTLEDIVAAGTWDKTAFPYADANNDGSITQADVDIVKTIVDKTCGTVKYVNALGEVKDAHYPMSKYVCVGSFAINAMIVLGQDKCVGVSGSKTFVDEVYWTGIQDMTKISDNAKKADYEKVTKIAGVQAIFTGSDGVTNQADFETADINVVRLDFNGPNELAAIMIMGFLVDNVDQYTAIAAAYDAVTKKIDEVKEKHPELANMTAFNCYNKLGINSDKGAQGWMSEKIGIANAWKYDAKLDDKDALNVSAGDSEWYLNERFKPDYLICFSNYTYAKDSTPDEVLGLMVQYFSKMDAFPEKTVLFNSSIPQHAKLAYLIEGLFPDVVEKGYGNSVLQSYINTFNPDFAKTGYDVSKDGLFLVTPEEIKDYYEKHKA